MSADATNWVTSLREVNMTWLDREIEEEDSYKNNIEKNVLQILETLLSFCGKTHGKQLDSCQIFLLMQRFVYSRKIRPKLIWQYDSISLDSFSPSHTYTPKPTLIQSDAMPKSPTHICTLKLTGRSDAAKYALQTLVLKIYTHMVFFSLSLFPRLNSMGHYINDACSNAGANLSRQCASQPGTLPDYKTAALLCV